MTSTFHHNWLGGLLAILIAMAACFPTKQPTAARGAGEPKAEAGKGVSDMAGLKLTITLQHPEVLVGEPLTVEMRLENAGAAPVEVFSRDSPSEFEFTLRPLDAGRQPIVLSARRARLKRDIEPGPALPTRKVPLAPGAHLIYRDDLADYAVVTPVPGKYQLSVTYFRDAEYVTSPAVPLSIVAPRVKALSVLAGPADGGLALVFAHAVADGSTALYQRESHPGKPKDGVAYRRVDVKPPQTLQSVAVAVETTDEPVEGVRWFGWLQGEAVGAGVAQLHTLFLTVEPVPLGLRSAQLQPIGWQPTTKAATFAALGLDAQGQAALGLVNFTDARRGVVRLVMLGDKTLPEAWAVRLAAPDAGRYEVVTVRRVGAVVRVERRNVSASSGTADTPVTLAERDAQVAALALYSLPAEGGGGVVDVLLGPPAGQGKMTLLRLPLAGGAPVGEWSFVAPQAQDTGRPTEWALSPLPVKNPVVLARLGDRLLVRRAASGDWQTLAESAAQAARLRLEIISGVVWAVWADPVTGINYKRVELP